MLKFQIEQIALYPANTAKAIKLLKDLGMTEWFKDNVVTKGKVWGNDGENSALLQFNYQAGNGADLAANKPLELEVLKYVDGDAWMDRIGDNLVSHFGMHVTAAQLEEFRAYFLREGYLIAQEVKSQAHTNPYIAGKRLYHYVIFDTNRVIGVDLKFIVRLNPDGSEYMMPVDEPTVDGPKPKRRGVAIKANRTRR